MALAESAAVEEPAVSKGEAQGAAADLLGDSADQQACFDCNICLELAHDPVITLCGHLYCWPCLYRWMQVPGELKECPVCKAGIDEDKVIPLYGRGCSGRDPRKFPVEGMDIPARPAAQRPPSVPQYAQGPNGGGVGAMPLLGLHMPPNGAGPHPNLLYGEPLSPEQQQQAFLSRLLLMLGSFVIMCLLLF